MFPVPDKELRDNMKISRQLSLIALLFVSAGAAAQVYECTDANGKKTYSKDCPTTSVKEKEIEGGVSSPGGPGPSMDEKTRKANEAFEKRRVERQKQEAEEEKRAADARKAVQACNDAKARLDMLESGRPARRVDPVTGDHVVSDDSRRQAEIDAMNAQVAQNCK